MRQRERRTVGMAELKEPSDLLDVVPDQPFSRVCANTVYTMKTETETETGPEGESQRGNEAGRQTGRQTERQTDRPAGKPIAMHVFVM